MNQHCTSRHRSTRVRPRDGQHGNGCIGRRGPKRRPSPSHSPDEHCADKEARGGPGPGAGQVAASAGLMPQCHAAGPRPGQPGPTRARGQDERLGRGASAFLSATACPAQLAPRGLGKATPPCRRSQSPQGDPRPGQPGPTRVLGCRAGRARRAALVAVARLHRRSWAPGRGPQGWQGRWGALTADQLGAD